MPRRLGYLLATLVTATLATACGHGDHGSPPPEPTGSASVAAKVGSHGIEPEFRSIVTADSAPAVAANKAAAAASAAPGGTTGGEASPSSTTGPANGSAAIGGKTGG